MLRNVTLSELDERATPERNQWLRSLNEGRAVDDSVRPLYDAVLDALAKEDYRGAVDLQRQGE